MFKTDVSNSTMKVLDLYVPSCCTCHLTEYARVPTVRHSGVSERTRKKGHRPFIHAFWHTAAHLGVHWVEIDEPGFEEGLSDRFEGGACFAKKSDANIEVGRELAYPPLHMRCWSVYLNRTQDGLSEKGLS